PLGNVQLFSAGQPALTAGPILPGKRTGVVVCSVTSAPGGGAEECQVRVLDAVRGTLHASWELKDLKFPLNWPSAGQPVVADLRGDGRPWICLCLRTPQRFHIVAFHGDGTLRRLFPLPRRE